LIKISILRETEWKQAQNWITVGSERKLKTVKARKERVEQASKEIDKEWKW